MLVSILPSTTPPATPAAVCSAPAIKPPPRAAACGAWFCCCCGGAYCDWVLACGRPYCSAPGMGSEPRDEPPPPNRPERNPPLLGFAACSWLTWLSRRLDAIVKLFNRGFLDKNGLRHMVGGRRLRAYMLGNPLLGAGIARCTVRLSLFSRENSPSIRRCSSDCMLHSSVTLSNRHQGASETRCCKYVAS